MGTINTNLDGLKSMAATYMKALPGLDLDGLDNGLKCFNIAYLSMREEKPSDRAMAAGLFQYINRQMQNRELALMLAGRRKLEKGIEA